MDQSQQVPLGCRVGKTAVVTPKYAYIYYVADWLRRKSPRDTPMW